MTDTPFCDLCNKEIDLSQSCVMFPNTETLRCLRCHKENERAILASLVFSQPERTHIHIQRLNHHKSARIVHPSDCCCTLL